MAVSVNGRLGGRADQPYIIEQNRATITRNSDNSTDATEAVLATVTIPGNCIGPNGSIDIEQAWEYTNSASTKHCITRFGGTSVAGPTFTTTQNFQSRMTVRNQNNPAAQKISNVGIQPYASSAGAVSNLTVDTAQSTTIEFRCKWTANVSAESISLVGYRVTVFPDGNPL